MARIIKIEIEIEADEDQFEYDTDRQIAEHAASCFIGNDFESVEIRYEGESI